MYTGSAARSLERRPRAQARVTSVHDLVAQGWTTDAIRGHVRAARWQRIGRAVILHNSTPTANELRRAALIVLGPRVALTSFTALDEWGLKGWERDAIHVLVPRGARVVRPPVLHLRVHYVGVWRPTALHSGRRLHRPAQAALRAAAAFERPRPACGVLAAVVQQRLVRPGELLAAVEESPRLRHRAQLLSAIGDISQGAQALSEIDFAKLCHSAGLPAPARQTIRKDLFGRRRYLDVEWVLPNGERVVVEVDGALHLAAVRWWDDQLRQNELVISGDRVLRFPSVVVRCERELVVDQLRRVLITS
jgi:hypothetical protein